MSGRGSSTSRFPIRAVGIESSSLLEAKYEAKKIQSRILENSTGWNSKLEKWIHSRAPLMGVKNRGATNRRPPRQEQEVAVPLEVPGEPHGQKCEDVETDADGGPAGLRLGESGVPAGDDDVADPVEQRGQGKDDGIRLRNEPPVGHVRHQREAEDDPEEGTDVRGDLRLVGRLGNHVQRHRDHRGEHEEAEFGTALGFGSHHVARNPRRTGSCWHSSHRSGAK